MDLGRQPHTAPTFNASHEDVLYPFYNEDIMKGATNTGYLSKTLDPTNSRSQEFSLNISNIFSRGLSTFLGIKSVACRKK